ncbi:MAG: AI-2E family transporter [Vicinamibacterales bacterium]
MAPSIGRANTMQQARVSARQQSIAIVAALAVGLYLSWMVVSPFLNVLAWAVVMVVILQPVHRRLEQRLGAGGWAAAASTAITVAIVLVPLGLILSASVREIRDMADGLPESVDAWLDPANPTTGAIVQRVEEFVDLDWLREPGAMQESLQQVAGSWASESLWLVGGAIGTVVQMALVVFTIFFLFKDGRSMMERLYRTVPIENRRLQRLMRRTREVLEASVYGTLLLSALQGTLGGIAFMVLGLPSPFLWGVVMMVASLVPLLGAFVVWGPAAIYLATTGHLWQAAALTAWGMAVIGLADNVLRPVLVGNRTRMHELLIFFGVLGGIQAFGVLGFILGPVVFAVTLALLQAVREVGMLRAPAQAHADPEPESVPVRRRA